ncbi:MAG: hypothetical protein GXX08_10620 [Firmicutes bacterium]|nr:hypothetical protein [Bacillota bacterium]
MRRLVPLVLVVVLLSAVSGCCWCGGGGIDTAQIQAAISERIAAFAEAVEDYDVDGMLGFLDESSFSLTICEGDSEYNKTYAELKAELEEDEPKQLQWRRPVSEGGNGYVLTMELGTLVFSSVSATGAQAATPFTIKEQAEFPEIPEETTDGGTIACEMVKLGGQWLCQKMTITYQTVILIEASRRGAASMESGDAGSGDDLTHGFGFGKLAF